MEVNKVFNVIILFFILISIGFGIFLTYTVISGDNEMEKLKEATYEINDSRDLDYEDSMWWEKDK